MDINLNGTLNMLKVAQKKCRQFISEWVWKYEKKNYGETDSININLLSSDYAKSKAIGES